MKGFIVLFFHCTIFFRSNFTIKHQASRIDVPLIQSLNFALNRIHFCFVRAVLFGVLFLHYLGEQFKRPLIESKGIEQFLKGFIHIFCFVSFITAP
ncbi:MAG: hypothetical protein EBU82_13855 [Flavobacteriia bacterium]|nr:hypothetical protein [Flavobacteriia bacterium]